MRVHSSSGYALVFEPQGCPGAASPSRKRPNLVMPAPNSTVVVLTAVLLAAAAFVLTIRTWNRFVGGRSGAFAGRVGMLLVTQLAMVAAFAAAVNSNFAFYTTWQDLIGTAKGGGTVVAAAGSSSVGGKETTFAPIVVNSRAGGPILGGVDTAKFGAIDYVDFHGVRTGLSEKAHIYL